MQIEVKFGNYEDLEEYLKTCKHHDQRTIKTYWARVVTLNKKSSNSWFLALSRQSIMGSIVSILPSTALPVLVKAIPPFRWRVGVVFMPTPAGKCFVFGETVIDQAEITKKASLVKEEIVIPKVFIPETPTLLEPRVIKRRGKGKKTIKRLKHDKSEEPILKAF